MKMMMRDDAAANVMKKATRKGYKGNVGSQEYLVFEFAEAFKVKVGQMYGISVDEIKGRAEIVEIVGFKRGAPILGSERHIATAERYVVKKV